MMIKVDFHDGDEVETEELNFVVIGAQYQDQWIVVRHEDRTTWEIPGGHVEPGEEIKQAAERELWEETGAEEFTLTPINVYSVQRKGEDKSFGQLYYAQVEGFTALPDWEIEETKLVDSLPEELTYPVIQPKLFTKLQNQLLNGFPRLQNGN